MVGENVSKWNTIWIGSTRQASGCFGFSQSQLFPTRQKLSSRHIAVVLVEIRAMEDHGSTYRCLGIKLVLRRGQYSLVQASVNHNGSH